ncbi:MAG: ABC-type transport auxiliary lipoprotein family protein [Planctomycetota bacterium]
MNPTRASSRLPVCLLAATLGCGAVEVPNPRSYRLPLADGSVASAARAEVLRVQDLRLGAHLSPENLMVADGPNLLQAHPLDLWAGPLDRLVTDVVVRSLRRSGAFADVKCATDVGGEDLSLSATVTDFHYERRQGGAEAVVALDAQVRRAPDHTLLLAREWRARVPLAEVSAADAVGALAQGVQRVVQQLVAACATLPPPPAESERVPGLASPPGK